MVESQLPEHEGGLESSENIRGIFELKLETALNSKHLSITLLLKTESELSVGTISELKNSGS